MRKKLYKKIRKSNRIRRWKTWTFPSPGNKKESNKEEEEDIEENIEKEKEEKTDKLKMKVTYNDGKMNFLRKQEVKDLKKKIKEVKNETKKN